MDPTLSADTLDPSQAQDDIAAFVRSAPRACTPICCAAATVTPITVLPARTARTRGVAAGRSVCAQRKERLAAGGAQRSPDPTALYYTSVVSERH